MTGAGPFSGIDLTPFCFLVSALVLARGIHRYQLGQILPIARELVMETLPDGVLVVDPFNRLVDANRAAGEMLKRDMDDLIGHPLEETGIENSLNRESFFSNVERYHVYEVQLSSLYTFFFSWPW